MARRRGSGLDLRSQSLAHQIVTFDINWLDASSMAAGALNVGVQMFRRPARRRFATSLVLYDATNGAALPPVFLMIAGAAYSTCFLVYLQQASRPTLFFAGFAMLFALGEGIFRKPRG